MGSAEIPQTPTDDDALSERLVRISSTKDDLPAVAEVRRALKVRDTSGHQPTVAEHFDGWLPQQTHLRRAT